MPIKDEIRIDGANIAISHRKSGEMHKFITVLSTSGDDVLLSGEFNLEAIERLGKQKQKKMCIYVYDKPIMRSGASASDVYS